MVLPAVLVDAEHPPLEDREKSLDAVGGHITTGVLFGRVIDGFVRGELGATFW